MPPDEQTSLAGDHKAQLLLDGIYAAVVIVTVLCVTVLLGIGESLPADIAATVYGGAIGFAGGAARSIVRVRTNRTPDR